MGNLGVRHPGEHLPNAKTVDDEKNHGGMLKQLATGHRNSRRDIVNNSPYKLVLVLIDKDTGLVQTFVGATPAFPAH